MSQFIFLALHKLGNYGGSVNKHLTKSHQRILNDNIRCLENIDVYLKKTRKLLQSNSESEISKLFLFIRAMFNEEPRRTYLQATCANRKLQVNS